MSLRLDHDMGYTLRIQNNNAHVSLFCLLLLCNAYIPGDLISVLVE